MLLVDALVGMPFAPTNREHQVQSGPRRLGVALGLGVDHLAATYAYCKANIARSPPNRADTSYGDPVVEYIDPFGYLWGMPQPVAVVPVEEGLRSLGEDWSESSTPGPVHPPA